MVIGPSPIAGGRASCYGRAMTQEQGIMDVVTRLQGAQHALAGAIQAALAGGLTATQIGSLVELSARDVSALIKAWELI